jgi:hypothetical protein
MKARTAQINREAFVWCASAALAALLPLGLLLPFWVSVLLGSLAMIGTFAGWRGLRIPAWLRLLLTLSTAGLVLFAFGFRIGRDTGAGLLATMLALKLLETHQLRDARSLVSFSLFGLMAAFLQDQGPITLLLAVIATLIALAALMHVHQLELPDPTAMPVSRTQHLRAVLNLAALSIPLALVGFLLFPRLASPLWGLPNNSAARTGLSETMAPGDMTQLLSDDSPALRVQFFTPPPNPAQMFWRGPVLSQFDGRQWNLFRGLREIESGTLLEDGALVDYELTQEPTDRRLILSLDVAQAAPAGTDPGEIKLGWDRSLHSRKPLSQISQYRLRSAVQYRFEPELRATMRNWMLQLPQQTNPRTWIEVQQWRSDGLDDVAIIQRALNWFNREFFYTLAPRPLGQTQHRRVSVRHAGRLLRALRFRLHGDDADGGHSRPRCHWLPGRRIQPAGRLLAGSPIGCPCMERGLAAEPWLGAHRPHGGGRRRTDSRWRTGCLEWPAIRGNVVAVHAACRRLDASQLERSGTGLQCSQTTTLPQLARICRNRSGATDAGPRAGDSTRFGDHLRPTATQPAQRTVRTQPSTGSICAAPACAANRQSDRTAAGRTGSSTPPRRRGTNS